MKFDCARTCKVGHWCRFMPILRHIGPVRVNSHTATIKVKVDPDALAILVQAAGGRVLGHREHHLGFENYATGHGYALPSWTYQAPGWAQLVLTDSGTLVFDGANAERVKALEADFASARAEVEAKALGWLTERTPAGLVIHHPVQGSLTISHQGTVSAVGFEGQGCHAAAEAIGLHYQDGSVVNTQVHGGAQQQIRL